jgi:uncharacterized RDD family membrane protein YckC
VERPQKIAPAPLVRRACAILVDLALVYVFCLAPYWLGVDDERALVGVLVAFVYFMTRDSLLGGRSFGKKATRLRVLNSNTLVPVGLRESLRRNGIFVGCCFLALALEIAAPVFSLPFGLVTRIGVVGAAAFCFRYVEKEKHRTKMDVFGGTVVVMLT